MKGRIDAAREAANPAEPGPIIIAIDGFDGSGKTTLARGLVAELNGRRQTCQILGRREADSNATIAALTSLVLASDGDSSPLSPDGSAHVRLARLYERAAMARKSSADVVLLDRWIPSDLSRLPHGVVAQYLDMFRVAHRAAGVHLTLRLCLDFDTAWSRIASRPQVDLSPAERRGRAHNRVLFDRLATVWDQSWVAPTARIDTSKEPSLAVTESLNAIAGLHR